MFNCCNPVEGLFKVTGFKWPWPSNYPRSHFT